jgi:hypothetical protein
VQRRRGVEPGRVSRSSAAAPSRCAAKRACPALPRCK